MEQSCSERQVAELMLLASMYPDGSLSWQTPSSIDDLEETAQSQDKLAFHLRLHDTFTLVVTLPKNYPSHSKPEAYLECDGTVSTSRRKEARQQLQDRLNSLEPGEECLDILIQGLTDALSELPRATSSDAGDGPPQPRSSTADRSSSIKRVLLWSHHLLATSKRKDIVSWSRELNLAGYSRPGYPGAILIEGQEDDVDEFATRVKALRWQALQVRGEELSEARLLMENGAPAPFKEVEDIGDIVKGIQLRSPRLAEWFLEGMKIGH